MSDVSTPTVGVAGLAQFAEALRQTGHHIVGGTDDFRQCAEQIRTTLDDGHDMPVFVEDCDMPGVGSWVERLAQRTSVVIVITSASNAQIDADVVDRVPLPASGADLFKAAGMHPNGADRIRLDADGTATITDDQSGGDNRDSSADSGGVDPADPNDWPVPAPKPDRAAAHSPPHQPDGAAPTAAGEAGQPAGSAPSFRAADRAPRHLERNHDPEQALAGAPTRDVFDAASNVRSAIDYDPDAALEQMGLGRVVFVFGGSGGVGKTSTAIHLAQRAGEHGQLRTILIDMNRGQPDIAKYLRVHKSSLPTAYDASAVGDASRAIVDADKLNAVRKQAAQGLNKLAFGVALGPDRDHASKQAVPAETYQRIIAAAKGEADVVIVDTQSLEATDNSGLIDKVALPELVDDGWGLMVTGPGRPSVINVHERMEEFVEAGVSRARLMVASNRRPEASPLDDRQLDSMFKPVGEYVGFSHDHEQFAKMMDAGAITTNNALTTVLDKTLYRATGRAVFDQQPEQSQPSGGFRGWLAKLANS